MAQTHPDAAYGNGFGSAVVKKLPEELMEFVLCLSVAIFWLRSVTTTEIEQSVCQSDYLRVRCGSPDEVIVLSRAEYGRMRMSKCVRENFGYVGCSNDILGVLDGLCSGRRECSIRVLDENFPSARPCHEDLKSYLEVHYSCTRVMTMERQSCQLHHHPLTIRNQSAYLSSLISAETGCGTSEYPWAIQVKPGQRVNVTLLDFAGPSGTLWSNSDLPTDGAGRVCRVYATIREGSGNRRSVTICGGQGRVRHVHISQGNFVEVRLITTNHPTRPVHFLLRYEAIGCPQLAPPSGGWAKQTSDIAVLGCSESPETWQLICHGATWIGVTQNCSEARTEASSEEGDSQSVFPLGLSVLIVAVLALAIWLGIVAVGIVCNKSMSCDGDSVLADQVRTGVEGDCSRCCSIDGRHLHGDTLPKEVDAVQNSRSSFPCGQHVLDGHYNTWPKHAVVYAVQDAGNPAGKPASMYQRSVDDNNDGYGGGLQNEKQGGVRFAWPNPRDELDCTGQRYMDDVDYALQAAWESTPAGFQVDAAGRPLDDYVEGGSVHDPVVPIRVPASGYQ